MADTDKIIQELNKLFAEPLPEFYTRRIIFWVDEDKEYEDKLEDVVLDNARFVILGERNQFEIKKLIACDDPDSNILVYTTVAHSNPDDDWLLDVKLYSGQAYRADLLSQWMQEMGIENTQPVREAVRGYKKYFNSAGHRNKIANLPMNIKSPAQVHIAVLAGLCGQKDPRPENIIKAVLKGGLEPDNAVYATICKNNADKAFWAVATQVTGYIRADQDLKQLATHILLTAATQTMAVDYLAGLEEYISSAYKAYCYDLVAGWMRGNDADKANLYAIATSIEEELYLPQRFNKLDIEDLAQTECFSCIDEIILAKLMRDIGENHLISVSTIQSTVERRRTGPWYQKFKDFYEGVYQVSKMQAFFLEHSTGFHTVEPKKVWEEYTGSYYQMDTYYRLFHCAYAQIKQSEYHDLEDLFKKVVDKVEGLYNGWFLAQLGENWTNACEADLKEFGFVPSIEQQTDFYRRKVCTGKTKTFVIISDALRYEVAVSLAQELEQETHGKVSCESCEAIFPAVTKYGMAALLPHKKLTVEMKNNTLEVYADGVPTNASYREKILKAANPSSVVIRHKDFDNWTRSERADCTRGKDIIYIYHDVIDDTGHSAESRVFTECARAIAEIKKVVRDITNDCNGTRILITADHGFLYTYAPLKEDSKVSKISFSDTLIECDRRHAVLEKGAKPDHLMPVKFFRGENDYDGFAPRENIRIKTAGSQNYVHGGVSLQEKVVPIITYHHVRTNGAEYQKNSSKYKTEPVELALLSSARKASNMIFTLDFYQKDAVGGNREAATYELYFTDEADMPISDVQQIIADRANSDIQERQYHLTFNLKPVRYDYLKTYFLVIAHKDNKIAPQKIPFQIDIAFALDDFGFNIFS